MGHDDRRGDPAIEFEADALALQSLSATLESEITDAPVVALVGMRLALLATELNERALFVRLPNTHPSASQRWATGIHDRGATQCHDVELYTQTIAAAVETAGDPDFRVPTAWWKQAFSSHKLATDVHDKDYYDSMRHFDQLGFDDPNDSAGLLEMFEKLFGIALTGAAIAAAEISPYAGLRWLDISKEDAHRLCDRPRPLGFYTLLQAIKTSPALVAIDEQATVTLDRTMMLERDEPPDMNTMRLMLSWCIATLIAGIMQGKYERS